jgi:spermidine synthase
MVGCIMREMPWVASQPERIRRNMKTTSKGSGSDTGAIPGRSPRAVGRLGVGKYQGHRALITDGVIFSVAVSDIDPPFGYWAAMLPSGKPRTALLLGLGGGTLAHMLSRRFHHIRITGIDNDPDLLTFAREHFDLDLPNLKVVVTDAFDYVTRCRRRFDFVAVDLFVGSAFERGVLSPDFLRRLNAIRSDDGEIAINLYRDRCASAYLAQIRRVLPVSRVDRLPCNVIAHCCPAPVLQRPK